MRSIIAPLVASILLWCAGLTLSTQILASIFSHQQLLPGRIAGEGEHSFYWPWASIIWDARWGEYYPKPFALLHLWEVLLSAASIAIFAVAAKSSINNKPFGKDAWAKFEDVQEAGLFATSGAVIGKFGGEVLAFDGPEHHLLIGASRAGKGRGHVIPTLLSWSGSALVLDVKGELDAGDARHGFRGTSGFRAELGRVLRFAPTEARSHSFNPLFEVRRGANEIRDVQNIVEALVQPHGETRGAELFWNNKGKDIITGVVVHVLYNETIERKTLAVVREKLRDLDRTAEEMRLTLHRLGGKTNQPEVHPEVLHAAESYLSSEERLRSGVKATAESFFGIFADPIVVEKTSSSDFRIGDLMCGDKPVTLYLQPPPSDAPRLMPLMRLFINLAARSLMEDQTHDGQGREKKHRLLMLLDEFAQLGRLDFFEKMMGAMAGYGIKVYLVCQSLNHIIKTYGRIHADAADREVRDTPRSADIFNLHVWHSVGEGRQILDIPLMEIIGIKHIDRDRQILRSRAFALGRGDDDLFLLLRACNSRHEQDCRRSQRQEQSFHRRPRTKRACPRSPLKRLPAHSHDKRS